MLGLEPVTIPEVEVMGGTLQSTIYQLINASGWDAELLRSDGTQQNWPAPRR